MPRVYKPMSSSMYPNGDIIDPTLANAFEVTVNGSTCIAYRVKFYNMNNETVDDISAERINLISTLYNGDSLEYTLNASRLTEGNEYKWGIDLYGNDLSCTVTQGVVTSSNHNMETGDVVYVSTSASNPLVPSSLSSAFSAYTPYYVGKIDKDSFALYAYLEGARNSSGKLGESITTTISINISNVGISDLCIFKAYTTPTLSLASAVIDSYKHVFAPTFTQSEGAIVNSFFVEHYSTFNTKIINSGNIFSSKLEYEMDGLLSGYTYYIKFTVTDNLGQTTTMDFVEFPVLYSTDSMGVEPTASNNSENSCVDVSWAGIVQLPGNTTGTTAYVDNYRAVGNKALKINSNSTLYYEGINCKEGGSVPMFNWNPLSDDWSGSLFKMENTATGDYLEIKYSDGVFTKDENGSETVILNKRVGSTSSFYIGIVDGDLIMIPNDDAYLHDIGKSGMGVALGV